jgi:hypothetical protein
MENNYVPKYKNNFRCHEQLEQNKLIYNGFSCQRNMIHHDLALQQLTNILLEMDNKSGLNLTDKTLCVSIRPNIGFDEILVLNKDYNLMKETQSDNKVIKDKRRLNHEKQLHDNEKLKHCNRFITLLDMCNGYSEKYVDELDPETAVIDNIKCRETIHKTTKKPPTNVDHFLKMSIESCNKINEEFKLFKPTILKNRVFEVTSNLKTCEVSSFTVDPIDKLKEVKDVITSQLIKLKESVTKSKTKILVQNIIDRLNSHSEYGDYLKQFMGVMITLINKSDF